MNDEIEEASGQSVPETAPEEPVLSLPPDVVPQPTPEPAPPMEVISVDELLDRLIQGDGEPEEAGESEEAEEGEETVEGDLAEAEADVPVVDPDPVAIVVEQIAGKLIDMIGNLDRIEEHLEVIEQTTDHPALTTSFADYTVTEALLLLLLLSVFIAACARMLRGGLSWLRS